MPGSPFEMPNFVFHPRSFAPQPLVERRWQVLEGSLWAPPWDINNRMN